MSDALEALVRVLPAELTDETTLVSLGAVLVIVFSAWGLAEYLLDHRTPSALRFLFVWHAFDAMIHFALEGSFLYHCFYSAMDLAGFKKAGGMGDVYHPDPPNFLGTTGLVHGAQAGAVGGVEGPMAMLCELLCCVSLGCRSVLQVGLERKGDIGGRRCLFFPQPCGWAWRLLEDGVMESLSARVTGW